jgi:hypothetical protein
MREPRILQAIRPLDSQVLFADSFGVLGRNTQRWRLDILGRPSDRIAERPDPYGVLSMSRLQPVRALDDSRHVGSLPVRLDPAHALVFPSRRRAAPVAAHHEAMEQLSAGANAFQFLQLAYVRNFNLTGKEIHLFGTENRRSGVGSGWALVKAAPGRNPGATPALVA